MINNFKNNVLSTIEKMKNTEPMKDMNYLYYSSYLFLIASLYALYYKLYLCFILVFYLFITAMVHWNDYNNKFKLYGDHYMISIITFYTIYICCKIKYYNPLISIPAVFIIYIISYYYYYKSQFLVSSNLWILSHSIVSICCIYIFNKLTIYNKQKKKN